MLRPYLFSSNALSQPDGRNLSTHPYRNSMDLGALRSAASSCINEIGAEGCIKQGRVLTVDYPRSLDLSDLIQDLQLPSSQQDSEDSATIRQSLAKILILEDFLHCLGPQLKVAPPLGLHICRSIASLSLPPSAFAAVPPYLLGMLIRIMKL